VAAALTCHSHGALSGKGLPCRRAWKIGTEEGSPVCCRAYDMRNEFAETFLPVLTVAGKNPEPMIRSC